MSITYNIIAMSACGSALYVHAQCNVLLFYSFLLNELLNWSSLWRFSLGNTTFESVRDLIQINIALVHVQSTRNTIVVDGGKSDLEQSVLTS